MVTLNHTQLKQLGAAVGGALVLVLSLVWFFHWRLIESTDNAYIKGNIIPLASKVTAAVEAVLVEDGQPVEEGQILIKLDSRDSQARLDRAKALYEEAVSQHAQMQEKEKIQQLDVKQNLSKLEAAKAENERTEKAYSRAGTLSKENIASQSNLDSAKANYAQGKSQLELAMTAKEQSERNLTVTRLEVERLAATVKAREADFKLAQIELDDTTIKAPIKGIVGQRAVKKGQLVKPGTTLATLANLDDIWVIANFKETQIARMAPGQKATVKVDGFSGHVFEGEVDNILPASGAEFSLLPPDNATGNFTKIVQRVPVRIKIANPHKVRLIPGLSVYACVKR